MKASTRKRRKGLVAALELYLFRMSPGHEYLEGDVVVKRLARKPPTYLLERYADDADGVMRKVQATMIKTKHQIALDEHGHAVTKPAKGYELAFLGPNEEPTILRFATRKRAISAFSVMEPVREEEEQTDDEVS